MIQHMFSAGHNSAVTVTGAPRRQSIQQAWDANKRHLHAVYSNKEPAESYAVRKEVTFRLDVILQMHYRGAFSAVDAGAESSLGGRICTALHPQLNSAQHYPFWILPTEEVNRLMVSLACRFVKPLNRIFSLVPRLAEQGAMARIVVYHYTAKLFTRLLLLSLTNERDYDFDKWIWEKTWRVKRREGARQVTYTRTGLDIRGSVQSAGVAWLGDEQMDWAHNHLDLELLQRVYIPRSPGHAAWSAEPVTKRFCRATIATTYVVQALLHRAVRCRERGRNEPARKLERCAARVAAQEIARSYQLHLVERLQLVWRNSVIRAHRSPDDFRKAFPDGPTRLVSLAHIMRNTREATIIMAKDISTIMQEGLAIFEPQDEEMAELREDLGPRPAELPPWMSQRASSSGVERAVRWTEKVYEVLFRPMEGRRWANAKFMQDCDSLRKAFNDARHHDCKSFDGWLSRTIGGFILVMFNSDKTKELSLSSNVLAGLPNFFRIQFWAPVYDHYSPSSSHVSYGIPWEHIRWLTLHCSDPTFATNVLLMTSSPDSLRHVMGSGIVLIAFHRGRPSRLR